MKVLRLGTVSLGVSQFSKEFLDLQVGADPCSAGMVLPAETLSVGSVIGCSVTPSMSSLTISIDGENIATRELSGLDSSIAVAVGVEAAAVQVHFYSDHAN